MTELLFYGEREDEPVRLNKYMSEAGFCSRREADRMIDAGRVFVDGEQALPGLKVRKGQRVTVDGKPLSRKEGRILLAVYKPRGVVCTTDKRWGDTTVYDMLNYPKRVFSVGRLDKDSEGLLLMTNDGELSNQIMKAGNFHEKEYLVTTDREITGDFLKKMSEGVFLRELNVTTRPCRVWQTGKYSFGIILTQGYNRQIRRMSRACGRRVTGLLRTRIMNIELQGLKEGECRPASREEITQLLELLHRTGKTPG